MLEKLQALAKNLENRIAQSLANHNALLGYSNAINDAIKLAEDAVDIVEPGPIADAVDAVGDAVTDVIAQAQADQSAAQQGAAQ